MPESAACYCYYCCEREARRELERTTANEGKRTVVVPSTSHPVVSVS